MEKENLQKVIEQIKKVSLTGDEKLKMQHNLSMYADLHMPVSSPFSIFSFFKQPLIRKMSYALGSIMILVLTGGTLAYASETSLPGDLLYPIKTNIVEPMKISSAKTQEEKAVLETEFANKRLKEAEDLDKSGRLTPQFKKELDDRFNTHLTKYNEFKKELEKNISTSSKEKTFKIQKEFDNKMNSHNEMLNKFDRDVKGFRKIERKATTTEENRKDLKIDFKRFPKNIERE